MDLPPPWGHAWRGRLDELALDSQALTGNPLGDPHRRPLYVYVPPGYDDDSSRRYPSLYLIQGLTGQLDMWRNRKAFQPSVLETIDDWFAGHPKAPAIVVCVDAWTSLGGSQFLDSAGTGRYHTYLCDEIVPFVDARYRTLAEPAHRGIAGKSSGGYGAMVTPMLRPDLFGGLATHAGDALFEACYLPEFRNVARSLRDEHGGSYEAFWADFRSRPGRPKRTDGELLNVWCMAACYSTDPDGTVRLPFDPATGRLVPDVWERWLAWDPVRMASHHADDLRGVRGIWVDADVATSTTSMSAPWHSGPSWRGSASPTSGSPSSCSTAPTRTSSGVIPPRSAGWRSASRLRPRRPPPGPGRLASP